MGKAKFCGECGRGYVTDHECPKLPIKEVADGHEINTITPEIPPAWQAVAKIFTQALCVKECEWCQSVRDPYNTGDKTYVQTECVVPTPRHCPSFDKYIKEHG